MVRSRELRPRLRRTGGCFSALIAMAPAAVLAGAMLLAAPREVRAQQPTGPDTARRAPADTIRRLVPDTGAARTDTAGAPRDTVPPPQLPRFPHPVPPGFADAVWVFTPDSIQRFSNAVTLADLLSLLPGIAIVRAGYYVQPIGVSALGQTGGRLRVFLDGYELAPLDGGVIDLSRIALAGIAEIRVERHLDELRIDLRTLSPSIPQPYEYFQAGVAEPGAKLFRGVVLVPKILVGPLSVDFERLDTDGYRGVNPGSETAFWGKWGKLWRNRGGIQAEFRSNTVHRNGLVGNPGQAPWVGSYGRTDFTLRGRWRFRPGLLTEAYIGSSSGTDPRLIPDSTGFGQLFAPPFVPALTDSSTRADSLAADSIARLAADTLLKRSDRQVGLRLSYLRGPFWGNAALRTHSASELPGAEGDITLGLARSHLGEVDAGTHLESWPSRHVADSRLRARLGPYQDISAFLELAGGTRGVPFLVDSAGGTLFSSRTAWRLGVDLDRSWLSAGIARISVTEDSVPGLGLPFDLLPRYYPAGSMSGWESHARVRLFWKPLSAEYWYLAWTHFGMTPAAVAAGIPEPIYTPQQQYRISLIYHQLPLPSGHLELYARLDAYSRGVMYLPVAPTTPVLTANTLNFYLQIRILDVRLFFQENGLTTQAGTLTDFPPSFNRFIPAPRIFYGVRWQFFN